MLARWGDVVSRNEELELWRELAADVTCRARWTICEARVAESPSGRIVEVNDCFE